MGQNKKSEPLFNQAVEKSIVGQYEAAIDLLHTAIKVDPTYAEAYLLLGNQHLSLEQYATARECYQHCLDLNPSSTRWVQEARDGIRTAEWRQHAVDNPVPFKPINLGPNVNTEADEYMPALTADYRTLVFTRRVPRRATTRRDLPQEEDFYLSLYDTMELDWGLAQRMPEPLNSNANEGAQTLSHDGRVVIFTACGRSGEPTGCDLYMSVRTHKGWGRPRNLGSPVNSNYWESRSTATPSISLRTGAAAMAAPTSGAAPSRRDAGASPATWVPPSTRQATRPRPTSTSTTRPFISRLTATWAWAAPTSTWPSG